MSDTIKIKMLRDVVIADRGHGIGVPGKTYEVSKGVGGYLVGQGDAVEVGGKGEEDRDEPVVESRKTR